jgi:hypothetical protein
MKPNYLKIYVTLSILLHVFTTICMQSMSMAEKRNYEIAFIVLSINCMIATVVGIINWRKM